jgi:putative flavoprotein involved in K+ transport
VGRWALFGDGLRAELERADQRLRRILERIDDAIERGGLDAPSDTVGALRSPDAHDTPLDLRAGGIGTVLWATGYRRSYPWLDVPVLDDAGEIVQRHGVTAAPGLFTLGLRFQRLRRSHMIGGVGADAGIVARRIAAGGASALPCAAAA